MENSPGQKNSRALRRTRCPQSMDVFILSDRPRMRKISPNSMTTLFSTIVQRIPRFAKWLCWRRRSSSRVAGLSMFLVERFSFVVSRCVDVRISSPVVSVDQSISSESFPTIFLCPPVVVEHHIRLLTHEDSRVNFLIKWAVQRCLQAKSERFISNICNDREHKEEDKKKTTTTMTKDQHRSLFNRVRRRMKSNNSNCSIELPVEVNRYDEWLMKLKRSLLGKWIDGVEKNLSSNSQVNELNGILCLSSILLQSNDWIRLVEDQQRLLRWFVTTILYSNAILVFVVDVTLRLFPVLLSLIFQRSTRSTWSVSSLIFLRSSPNNLLRLHLRLRRLVDQLKKVFASRSDVANADRSSSFATNGVSQTPNEAILDAYLWLKREISSIEIFCPSICKRFDVWLRHHRASIPSKRSLFNVHRIGHCSLWEKIHRSFHFSFKFFLTFLIRRSFHLFFISWSTPSPLLSVRLLRHRRPKARTAVHRWWWPETETVIRTGQSCLPCSIDLTNFIFNKFIRLVSWLTLWNVSLLFPVFRRYFLLIGSSFRSLHRKHSRVQCHPHAIDCIHDEGSASKCRWISPYWRSRSKTNALCTQSLANVCSFRWEDQVKVSSFRQCESFHSVIVWTNFLRLPQVCPLIDIERKVSSTSRKDVNRQSPSYFIRHQSLLSNRGRDLSDR